jgi:histidinol-phosphate phosphatase family protein
MSGRLAAFLDRDGTIIRETSYIREPGDAELLPTAAAAIRRLNERNIAAIVVTNQSGIARGLLSAEDYEAVRRRIDALLAASGARVDASYMCPHHPDVSGPCDCRKPGLALYRQAIAEHGIDATRSVFIGDRWRDVEPARALGGLGILLDVESTPPEDRERAHRESITIERALGDAVDRFLATLPASAVRQ